MNAEASRPTVPCYPLDADTYVRSRLSPQPEDNFYLHLADLREALTAFSSKEPVKVLDYGCGGSPYRSLFPSAVYHRADYMEMNNLDYRIAEDASLPDIHDNTYDIVLSTQVLEHVRRPEDYLREAQRVLRADGKLILTTHGVFDEHPCPCDFRRWTAAGLGLILDDAKFARSDIWKLTTNNRALFLLADNSFGGLYDSRKTKVGLSLWLFRKWFWADRRRRNLWADLRFAENKVVPASKAGHPIYIALFAAAYK